MLWNDLSSKRDFIFSRGSVEGDFASLYRVKVDLELFDKWLRKDLSIVERLS